VLYELFGNNFVTSGIIGNIRSNRSRRSVRSYQILPRFKCRGYRPDVPPNSENQSLLKKLSKSVYLYIHTFIILGLSCEWNIDFLYSSILFAMPTTHISQPYKIRQLIVGFAFIGIFNIVRCKSASTLEEKPSKSIEVLNPAISEILDTLTPIEVIGEGFTWSEGPVWVESMQKLLFTDVPQNKIYAWDSLSGVKEYLYPSGLDSLHPVGGVEGANGLALTSSGELLLCQHGNRAVAKMLVPLSSPKDSFAYLATQYNGKRFNSPNDLQIAIHGDIFFTDPPYGLSNQDEDEHKELSFNGVYRLTTSGKIILLDSTLSRPNGIALSPDETTLYVSNSDLQQAFWVRYQLDQNKNIVKREIFADVTHLIPDKKGLPDGLKISKKGIIFATGPGGVLVFNADGQQLGTILTGEATANCALDQNEQWLYMTAHSYLKRIKLR
jgi:gluconolactonase